jgi:hypothetical protein
MELVLESKIAKVTNRKRWERLDLSFDYRIIWHTVPWSYNPFLPLLIRQGMVLYVSMVLY